MAILVTCKCGQQFRTGDENAGRQASCPDCGQGLVIPSAPASSFADGVPTRVSMTSSKAITSLTLGLLSFVCLGLTGLPAVLYGLLGLGEVKRGRGRVTGGWMAVTGLVLGFLACSLTAVLLVPISRAVQDSTQIARCTNQLKQIGLAMHNYHNAWNSFPPAFSVDKDGQPLLSWRVALLPYLDNGAAIYSRFRLNEPWDSPHNVRLLRYMPSVYACPAETTLSPGETTYQVVVGPKTIFPGAKSVKIEDIIDGTSNTILVGEAATSVPWTKPQDLPFNMSVPHSGLGSRHSGGFNVTLADGSVRFIRNTILGATLAELLSRNGNGIIPVPW